MKRRSSTSLVPTRGNLHSLNATLRTPRCIGCQNARAAYIYTTALLSVERMRMDPWATNRKARERPGPRPLTFDPQHGTLKSHMLARSGTAMTSNRYAYTCSVMTLCTGSGVHLVERLGSRGHEALHRPAESVSTRHLESPSSPIGPWRYPLDSGPVEDAIGRRP